MKNSRLVSIDPSLTCSGWALFSLGSGNLLGVGKLRSLSPIIPLSVRLITLQKRIEELLNEIKIGQNDVLICEGETSMKDPRAAFKVERVRGIFETVARSKGVTVPGRVSPRSIQSEVMGLKGAQKKRDDVKRVARGIVSAMFSDQLRKVGFDPSDKNIEGNQDIVDAILVGLFTMSRINIADATGESLVEIFAEKKRGRRQSKYGWGKGESNTFGWSQSEIKKLLAYDK